MKKLCTMFLCILFLACRRLTRAHAAKNWPPKNLEGGIFLDIFFDLLDPNSTLRSSVLRAIMRYQNCRVFFLDSKGMSSEFEISFASI